jgi:hypothetical protein
MSDKIHVTVVGTGNKLTGVIAQSGGSFPKYEGEYEVTPSLAEDIKLETAKKVMTDDVTVKKVPRYDVANEAGGTTIYIGIGGMDNGGE